MKTKTLILLTPFLLLGLFISLSSVSAATVTKTLYSWAKDAAGNISVSRNDSVDITLPDVNTYYISPSGNDMTGNGSSLTPWKSLSKACNSVTTQGSTIHVNAGTYNESQRCDLAVGVSIEGEGGNSIINTIYESGSFGIINLGSTSNGINGNQSISSIKINGNETGTYGITVLGRSNVSIYNSTFINLFESAVIFDGKVSETGVVKATGNTFYNNTLYNCAGDVPFIENSVTYYYASGSLTVGYQKDMLIYNNSINEDGGRYGYGIKFANYGYNAGLKIYGNTIRVAPNRGIPNAWNFAIELWNGQAGGLEIYNNRIYGGLDICNSQKGSYAYGVDIHDNIIGWDTLSNKEESSITIESEWNYLYIRNNYFKNVSSGLSIWNNEGLYNLHHLYVTNNVYYNIGILGAEYGGMGMEANSTYKNNIVSDIYILNNTYIGYGPSNPLFAVKLILMGSLTNCYIQNNIIQGFRVAPIVDDHTQLLPSQIVDYLYIDHNIFYQNVDRNYPYMYATTPAHYTLSSNYIINPLFLSSTDFHLQSNSPAINAGVDVGLPYFGSSPDIGAFEMNY